MRLSRSSSLVALALATLIMAGGAWLTRDGLYRLSLEKRQTALLKARLVNAQQLMPQVERREAYARQAQVVQEKIRAAGFDPAKWSQRRVQRSTALVTRHEAQQLLQQMGDGQHRQWLAAETFEIAVLSPTAGLFNPPAADDR